VSDAEAGPWPARPPGEDPRHLRDRVAEVEREGRLGEVEGLKVSLAGAEDKLTQIETPCAARARPSGSACPPSRIEVVPARRTRTSVSGHS
jgi:hypothetical protein